MRAHLWLWLPAALGSTGCSDAGAGRVLPCTEQGVLAAVAEGGGPNSFDCARDTTVVTSQEIAVDRGVILDGGGKLTVHGGGAHTVFRIESDDPVELRALTVAGGGGDSGGHGIDVQFGRLQVVASTVTDNAGRGIAVSGGRTIIKACTVSNNRDGGVSNSGGSISIEASTVSYNATDGPGGGLLNLYGPSTVLASIISRNSALSGGGIYHDPPAGFTLTVSASTITDNSAEEGSAIWATGQLELDNNLISGECQVLDPEASCNSAGALSPQPGG